MSALGPEEIYQRAVMVNDGSGVLVTALSADHSYVLTARHNLLKERTNVASLMEPNETVVKLRDGTEIEVRQLIVSPMLDIAVIVVVSQTLEPTATSTSVEMEQSMWLVGFPEIRRNLNDPLRLFTGQIESFGAMSIDVSTKSFAPVDEVRGVSGGGVYIKAAKRWILVAVECEMEGRLQEGHNWLRCIGIPAFDDLIREHGFPPILPPFLLSFSRLADAAFPLPGFECPATLQRLRTVLLSVIRTNLATDSPTPNGILSAFGKRLLVQEDPECSLLDRKLWISWLEYLTLSVLLDRPQVVDADYIETLRSRRRFLYSGSDGEWTAFVERIIQSDLGDLADDGLVLVSNRIEGSPAKTRSIRDLSRVVPDIGLPLSGALDIGIPRKPIGKVKLFHLDGLHMDCIVRQEELYDNKLGLDEHIVLQLLAEAYRASIAQ
ncbi:ABC-three component system protein [Paraburkholderia saeva]|uniref:ABC-three component systems C-terminal domain-containing protein n=1 Tax=Paraburkholderia saeva TaxID=2777537 RepID=A0A9N8WZG5_9BURK|nr:ABC-three component system protein [Paraburkholderia saeva]CAG4886916.1 hypothetical protein LMG31841_00291 [Paraburkholderia saeva]CAG4887069.1 hypothetical protein R70241_00326 [Paraburkholderia saeva]